MSRRRGFSIAILVAGMILATSAEGALGASAAAQPHRHRPDAALRYIGANSELGTYRDPGRWIGSRVRNSTATGQTISDTLAGAAPKDAEYVYQLKIRNPGAARRFTIAVSGTGTWPVAYFVRGRDVTSAIVSGAYRTPVLDRGETFIVRITASLGRPGTSLMRLIRVSSAANPQSRDAVRLRIEYDRCGC